MVTLQDPKHQLTGFRTFMSNYSNCVLYSLIFKFLTPLKELSILNEIYASKLAAPLFRHCILIQSFLIRGAMSNVSVLHTSCWLISLCLWDLAFPPKSKGAVPVSPSFRAKRHNNFLLKPILISTTSQLTNCVLTVRHYLHRLFAGVKYRNRSSSSLLHYVTMLFLLDNSLSHKSLSLSYNFCSHVNYPCSNLAGLRKSSLQGRQKVAQNSERHT
jgi:hypothetical protein